MLRYSFPHSKLRSSFQLFCVLSAALFPASISFSSGASGACALKAKDCRRRPDRLRIGRCLPLHWLCATETHIVSPRKRSRPHKYTIISGLDVASLTGYTFIAMEP